MIPVGRVGVGDAILGVWKAGVAGLLVWLSVDVRKWN